jgi:hypothetical protein
MTTDKFQARGLTPGHPIGHANYLERTNEPNVGELAMLQ